MSNDNNESEHKSSADFLANMKPLMNNIMGMINSNINNNTNKGDDEDSYNVAEGGTIGLGVTTPKPTSLSEANNEAMNSVFDHLTKILNDMNKYKDRPYLALMPKIFEAMSQMPIKSEMKTPETDIDNYETESAGECSELVSLNSKRICEMLKDTLIEDLCNVPEFRERVEIVFINFNKFLIFGLKMRIKELEDELSKHLNDSASASGSTVYDLLEKLSNRFDKRK